MAIKDKLEESQEQPGQEMQQLSEADEQDLEIMVLLAKRMIDEGGQQVLDAAQKSSDPSQVIGQFLMQLGSQLAEMMPDGMKPSPAIMLAEGGWLEQISDFLQEEYGISKDIMDRAEIFVAHSADQMRASQQAGAGNDQQQAPAQQPPMPQAGGM